MMRQTSATMRGAAVGAAALFVASMLLLAGCATGKGGLSLPSRHPEALGSTNPVCSKCHDSDGPVSFADFDHGADWGTRHKYPAFGEGERVCEMCHRPKGCDDCHNTGSELSPAIRRVGEVGRELPHRGDYLTRHRFDARVDPTTCLRCHGSPKTSEICAPCHG